MHESDINCVFTVIRQNWLLHLHSSLRLIFFWINTWSDVITDLVYIVRNDLNITSTGLAYFLMFKLKIYPWNKVLFLNYNFGFLYVQSVIFTIRYITLHYITLQYSTVQYSTVQYSTVQYSTVQYSTVQYILIQYNTINTIQYNTIQYNTIQYNTIQYNTIQYNTILIGYQTFYCTIREYIWTSSQLEKSYWTSR